MPKAFKGWCAGELAALMLSLHVHFDAARSKFCGSGPFTAAVFAAPQPHSFRTEKFSSTFPALATYYCYSGWRWCDDYQDRSFTTSLRLVVLSVALVTCLTGFPSCTQFPRARINSTSKEKGPRRYIVPPYGPLTKGEKREQPRPFSSLILNDIL